MARKDTVYYVLEASKSLAASFNTAPTMVTYLDNIAYQIDVTTTNSTGSFAVQASLDYSPGGPNQLPANPGNWINLVLSGGTPTVAAANDDILIDLNQLPYKAIRLAYTSTIAGTGTCSIKLMAKQLGG